MNMEPAKVEETDERHVGSDDPRARFRARINALDVGGWTGEFETVNHFWGSIVEMLDERGVSLEMTDALTIQETAAGKAARLADHLNEHDHSPLEWSADALEAVRLDDEDIIDELHPSDTVREDRNGDAAYFLTDGISIAVVRYPQHADGWKTTRVLFF